MRDETGRAGRTGASERPNTRSNQCTNATGVACIVDGDPNIAALLIVGVVDPLAEMTSSKLGDLVGVFKLVLNGDDTEDAADEGEQEEDGERGEEMVCWDVGEERSSSTLEAEWERWRTSACTSRRESEPPVKKQNL